MYRESQTACVRCATPMELLETDGGNPVELCPSCGGAWMAVASFLSELRRKQPALAVAELMEHNDGTPRRPCPTCGEVMSLVWIQCLQLDQCERHGVWLDAGELERAWTGDVLPPEIATLLQAAERFRRRHSP